MNTLQTGENSLIRASEKPSTLKLPIFASKIRCGFPSPADDYCEEKLDLNDLLIKHSAATFFLRAEGDSMQNVGIFNNDLLIVDRSLSPTNGNIVVAAIDGELTVKRLKIVNQEAFLVPANSDYQSIELKNENNVHFWGVITYVIHSLSTS